MPNRSQERNRETMQRSAPGAFTPAMSSSGTSPPLVTVAAAGFIGSSLRVEMTTPGVLGVGVFRWQLDGGAFVPGVTVAASVPLVGLPSGTSLNFSAGAYSIDNVYLGVI